MYEHREVIPDPVRRPNMVSELTYLNYAHNRKLSPHISAEQWEPIYGPTTMTMEARYQRELVAERRLVERACKIETKRQARS